MTNESRQAVYEAIDRERDRQDAKWGDQSDKTWFAWLAILTEEVGEVAEVVLQLHEATDPVFVEQKIARLRSELTQVAAVSIQCLELLEAG